jgi:hypothetical protein
MKAQHVLLCVALLMLLVGSTDAWGKKKAAEDEVIHAKKSFMSVLPMLTFGRKLFNEVHDNIT